MVIERNLSNNFRDAIQQSGVRPADLVSIQYPSGTIRLTNYAYDIEWDGVTYTSVGGLLSISPIPENGDIETSPIVVELSGLTQPIIAALYLYSHINRALTRSLATLRANGTVIQVKVLFDGLTTSATIIDAAPSETGSSPVIQIEAASHFGDLDQKRGRYTNDESQKDLFPGDKGFEFVTDLVEPLVWGRKNNL